MQGGGRPRGRGEDPGQASSFGTGCVVCTGRNSERGAGLVQPSLEATENFLSIVVVRGFLHRAVVFSAVLSSVSCTPVDKHLSRSSRNSRRTSGGRLVS